MDITPESIELTEHQLTRLEGAIDTHAHMSYYAEGLRHTVLQQAQKAGVRQLMNILVDDDVHPDKQLQTHKQMQQAWQSWCDGQGLLPEERLNLSAILGIHPARSKEMVNFPFDELCDMQRDAGVVAVGECGLDYHYEGISKPAQFKVFEAQIQNAITLNKPLIIHTRDAEADTVAILQSALNDPVVKARAVKAGEPKLPMVLHCFSGTQWLMEQALQMDAYVSFSGILTFKKSDEMRRLAAMVPLNRILSETDAPYLSPEPLRGRVNQPALVVHVTLMLAKIYNLPPAEMVTQITTNSKHLFGV